MTLTIEESEEVSEELLSILLTSVSKKKGDQVLLSSCAFSCFCLFSHYIVYITFISSECFFASLEVGRESFKELCCRTPALSPKGGQI